MRVQVDEGPEGSPKLAGGENATASGSGEVGSRAPGGSRPAGGLAASLHDLGNGSEAGRSQEPRAQSHGPAARNHRSRAPSQDPGTMARSCAVSEAGGEEAGEEEPERVESEEQEDGGEGEDEEEGEFEEGEDGEDGEEEEPLSRNLEALDLF